MRCFGFDKSAFLARFLSDSLPSYLPPFLTKIRKTDEDRLGYVSAVSMKQTQNHKYTFFSYKCIVDRGRAVGYVTPLKQASMKIV